MPLLHCNKCHSEYEAIDEKAVCPECKNSGYVLEKETALEKMVKSSFWKHLTKNW